MLSAFSRFGRLGASGTRSLAAQVASIFSDGTQGLIHDLDDWGTLYQDSAGTTPVTALEQSVGLILDKSKGLVLGPELVTNGDFSTDSGWAKGAGWTISGGTANASASTATANPGFSQSSIALAPGKFVRWSVSVSGLVGSITFRLYGSAGSDILASISANGTYSGIAVVRSDSIGLIGFAHNAGTIATIDNISVRELPGNHAYQPTSTSRAVLSRRVNLLTKTEDFADAVWTKSGTGTGSSPVVTPDAGIAPNGTLTADRVDFDRGAGNTSSDRSTLVSYPTVVSAQYTGGFWIKATTAGDVGKTLLFRQVAGLGYQSITLTSEWVLITKTETGSSGNFEIASRGGYTSSNQVSVLLWGASLLPADLASLPYQRVNTTTDYDSDASKFPTFLRTDGVDDGYVTNAIDFSATDKIYVGVGIRKLSDAARAVVYDLGNVLTANTFDIEAPSGGAAASYSFRSAGSAIQGAVSSGYAAPISSVVSGIGDIAGDRSTLRINGAQVAQNTGDQGSGNYSNAALNMFRRQSSTLPFNGWYFGGVIAGKTLTAAQISAVERWLAGKTKTVVLA